MFNRFYRLEIHSLMTGIFDRDCELLPPWTKELYLCTVAPLPSLWPPPLPKLNVQYIQTVCVCGGGGVELCCRPYSAGVLRSVSDQIQNLPNCSITPNKMTIEDDIKGAQAWPSRGWVFLHKANTYGQVTKGPAKKIYFIYDWGRYSPFCIFSKCWAYA